MSNINKKIVIPALCLFLIGSACAQKSSGAKENIKNKPKTPVTAKVNENKKKADEKMRTNINTFSGKSFAELFKYEQRKNPERSMIYSPYSYLSTLSMLNKYTEFNKDNELHKYDGMDFENYKVNNIETKNLVLVNGDQKQKKINTKEFQIVKFPKEAEAKSKKLQQDVLKEVLLDPDYKDPGIEAVFLNATRFLGYWSKEFEKERTNKKPYTLLNGKEITVDMMRSGNLAKDCDKAVEDDNIQVYRKPLKENKKSDKVSGYAYVIKPKNIVKNDKELNKVAEKLTEYVDSYDKKAKEYDEVYLKMPKIDIKSTYALHEMERENNKKFMNDSYKFKGKFAKASNKPMNISEIVQVAKLEVNEEKVEAKAVTGMVMTTSLPPAPQNIFELNADSPFFLVTTSFDTNRKEVISFVSFINNPIQK